MRPGGVAALFLVGAVGLAQAARADLSVSSSHHRILATIVSNTHDLALVSEGVGVNDSTVSLFDHEARGSWQNAWSEDTPITQVPERRTDEPELRELPPPPESAALFLSALLSVGAWHLARSARHLDLSHLPDWYHTAGPAQIGHAVVFDMDVSVAAFVPSAHSTPKPYPNVRILQPASVAWYTQWFAPVVAPRGPPA